MSATSDRVHDVNRDVRRRSITWLVIAEIAAMALWFVSSAVLGDMQAESSMSETIAALLTSSVTAGFVVGALSLSILGLADRYDPRLVFAIAAVAAALANAGLLLVPIGHEGAIAMRFITGVCLAGVYPVGMKIMVGWGLHDRGLLVGLLVGGLTLGSAFPHLLAWVGGAQWRLTTGIASFLALLAALMMLKVSLGPWHARAARFDPGAIRLAWVDQRLRRAFMGYLGHMWELYALWAWVGVAAAASYSTRMASDDANSLAKLTAFIAIGSGALMCPLAGIYADRIGKARITIIAMAISGSAAIATAVAFGGPVPLVFALFVIWGLAVIPDSAQFSALVADIAPAESAGSLMTLQTALGFLLTLITVQLTPLLASHVGWPIVLAALALGPVFGIIAMRPLQKLMS